MPISKHAGLRAAIATLFVFCSAPAVKAQGFFQSLFGVSSPAPQPAPRASLPPQMRYMPPPAQAETRSQAPDQSPRHEPGSGQYRTLCVRMCDGYYWPISQSASRSNFHRDAKLCSASCGTEARLFYHSNSTPDVNAMVDLTGRAYARLPNAFRYRKTLVAGCQCKPEPWSQSEVDRHRHYAGLEAPDKTSGPAPHTANQGIEVIAGAAIRRTTSDASNLAMTITPPAHGGENPAEKASAISTSLSADRVSEATGVSDAPQSRAKMIKAPAESARSPQTTKATQRRSIERSSNSAAVPTSPKLQKPGTPGAFGLGAAAVRWPGD